MSERLKDEVAVITGAGGDIGRAFAFSFAEHGAKILLPDINIELAESTAKDIRDKGGEAVAVKTDISDQVDTKLMAEKVITQYGKVDILINNAAIYKGLEYKPWDTLTVKEWDRVFEVNVRGTWLCCKAIAPFMQQRSKGKIINISSGIISCPPFSADHLAHYACSKAAVYTLTQVLARALGKWSIHVNAIAPGFVATEASLKMPGVPEDAFERSAANACINHIQEAEDLVGTAVFLASKESDYLTGQLIAVNGGGWLR
ncbi:SDR family NAD(P)-dependent oxidoreductase [Chloroflexota bacterium]